MRSITALITLISMVGSASATSGDHDTMDLIGFESIAQKIHFAETLGISGEQERLHFFNLKGVDPHKIRTSKKRLTPERLSRLKKRVQPMDSIKGARVER